MCIRDSHSNCGLYLDHHSTNKPKENELQKFTSEGGICEWYPADSAARVAFDLCSKKIDLSHLENFMEMVDKLDLDHYKDKKVIIKGCASVTVPTWAYLILTAQLAQVAKKIYYGEPRYAVKIFSRRDT